MYYQNYEDYMRSILGYPTRQNYMDTYESCNSCIPTDYTIQTPRYSEEIMDLYPEIYKILNPMVCKICEANTKPIDRELIEKMKEQENKTEERILVGRAAQNRNNEASDEEN